MSWNATELIRLLKTFKFWGKFENEMGFLKTVFQFLSFAIYSMFVVECDRNRKNSQNVHILFFFTKKKTDFSGKNLLSLKTVNVAISLGIANKVVNLLKIFASCVFFLKKRWVYSKQVWMYCKLLNVANFPRRKRLNL